MPRSGILMPMVESNRARRRRGSFKSNALGSWGAIGVFVLGCGDAPLSEPNSAASAGPPASVQPPVSEGKTQESMAPGHLEVTEEKVDPSQAIVSSFDPARSDPGYNLISDRFRATAELRDAHGKLVHSWSPPGVQHFSNADLQPNGDLLLAGVSTAEGTGYLMRLSFDGEVIFSEPIGSHHDVELTPDGRTAALTRSLRKLPKISNSGKMRDNSISIVDRTGRVIEEYSLTDLLENHPSLFQFQRVHRMNKGSKRPLVDLLQANSLEFMRYPELATRHPLYEPGNVLISIRHQDTVAVMDWPKKKLIWTWGQGELSGQHDAQQLENGNFLIFDNGLKNQRSRVIELDPVNRKIVWQYPQPGRPAFFTVANGSSQRLSNGNTLIANSDHGEAIEVTPEGDVVWHFFNPGIDSEGHRATIVRIKRYPANWIEPLLKSS